MRPPEGRRKRTREGKTVFNLNTCNTRGVAQQESGLYLRGATMTTHHARKRRPVTKAELHGGAGANPAAAPKLKISGAVTGGKSCPRGMGGFLEISVGRDRFARSVRQSAGKGESEK